MLAAAFFSESAVLEPLSANSNAIEPPHTKDLTNLSVGGKYFRTAS
jgi:hypothetical protein